jgi:hypothetical protein
MIVTLPQPVLGDAFSSVILRFRPRRDLGVVIASDSAVNEPCFSLIALSSKIKWLLLEQRRFEYQTSPVLILDMARPQTQVV